MSENMHVRTWICMDNHKDKDFFIKNEVFGDTLQPHLCGEIVL